MDQHAVPRQITTFEFKLIGFLTIRQFLYLLLFTGFTVITYYIIPVPALNLLLAALVAALGVAMAFVKHNERPLDVWIKNLFMSLVVPSQYNYHKYNLVPDFLMGVFATPSSPINIQHHLDANKKLNTYIGKTQTPVDNTEKQNISSLLHATPLPAKLIDTKLVTPAVATTSATNGSSQTVAQDTAAAPGGPPPFISGLIKNNKNDPLPDIMLYINSDAGQTVRILKTNHHGVFATFHPLPQGSYTLNPKDLGARFFFDTMNIAVDGSPIQPIDIYSKEIL